MLLLSRKKGEKIIIGKSVQIEIIEIDRGAVNIGIVAPKNIPVHRQEIFDEIVKQNQQSVPQDVSALKQTLADIKIDVDIKIDKNKN